MKKVIMLSVLILFSLTLVFAGGSKEKNEYVFGSDATWPPLEFVDENGDITGFEVELVYAISEHSGIPMKVRNVAWDGIFAGLANNAYDAVASGVTIMDERKETMDFTIPILEVTQSIITNKGAAVLKNENDLNGKTVGVQIGTTGNFAVEKIAGVRVRAYDDIGLAVEDLLNRNVDAVVADSLIASDFVLANENYANRLTVTGTVSGDVEQIGIAVKKGNKELLDLLNKNLKELFENGTIDALKAKWDIL
ncbi:MAG: transporter substrate-binding domain-containing protein [Sphaerochaetaceae bacterium]|jgi:polar amino acid transport system substrate-binding protein